MPKSLNENITYRRNKKEANKYFTSYRHHDEDIAKLSLLNFRKKKKPNS